MKYTYKVAVNYITDTLKQTVRDMEQTWNNGCLLESGPQRHGEEKYCKTCLKEEEKVMRALFLHKCIIACALYACSPGLCTTVYNSFCETIEV